jgi:hypothetical protein
MKSETDHPIDKGNVYRETADIPIDYVVVDGFYVNEDGKTQIRIRQYVDKPLAAFNSAEYHSDYSGKRTLTVDDVRDRILSADLIFDGKE